MALPGVRTTILDRFYNLARTDLPGGPLIALVAKRSTATSSTAPDFIPYYAISEQDVITQYGEDSQLHRAYYEVTTAGATNVALIPLPSDTVFNQNNATLTSATYSDINVFDEAFSAVESARADIVVPWGRGSNTYDWDDYATPVATPGGNTEFGFYADNASVEANSWAKKIADKCSEITTNSYPIIAVLGIKPILGAETPTPSQTNTGLSLATLVDREGFTTGSFINVIAVEYKPVSAPTAWGYSNGACLYAALISRLDSWRAPTGKPVYNSAQLRYNPTRTQALALTNKGVVPVMFDFQRVARWVDATTFAPAVSDYTRLSTVRIVFDAAKLVRNVAQNYIGEGMSVAMRNAFETQISSVLRGMQQLNAINHSDFRVQYAPSENKALVDLAIVPAFELRELIITISVNF